MLCLNTGSPFQFTVGPFGEGGTHKVRAGGPGLERAEVGCPAEFQVWTREAGPGKLGITVGGPAKAPINIVDNKDGSYQVTYTPMEPGKLLTPLRTIRQLVKTTKVSTFFNQSETLLEWLCSI